MGTCGGFEDNRSNYPIATTETSSYADDIRAEMAIANARLIAAAPTMLEVLRKILSECYVSENTDGGPVAEMSADVLDVIRAAIAKAEGTDAAAPKGGA